MKSRAWGPYDSIFNRKCKCPLRAKLSITEKIKVWGSELLKKTYLKLFVILSASLWSNCFEEKKTPGTYPLKSAVKSFPQNKNEQWFNCKSFSKATDLSVW